MNFSGFLYVCKDCSKDTSLAGALELCVIVSIRIPFPSLLGGLTKQRIANYKHFTALAGVCMLAFVLPSSYSYFCCRVFQRGRNSLCL